MGRQWAVDETWEGRGIVTYPTRAEAISAYRTMYDLPTRLLLTRTSLADPWMGDDPVDHKVTIRLRYANGGRTPWKWEGRCACGWVCQSWAWRREPYNYGNEADGTGALPIALEHVGLV